MNDLAVTIKGIILLEEDTYERFLSAENSMRLGIYFLIASFLIIGFPTFVSDAIDKVQPFTMEEAAETQEEFLQGFELITRFMPAESDDFQLFMDQFTQNYAMGAEIGVAIDALPRPIPRAVGGLFQALGSWVSSPFAHLASWMSYAIWVLLIAKISGGRGGVNRFLGLTALYAVPNLLSFLGFIPFLGAVISWVGVIWGWVVYVKAVQISQEFSAGKAILVAILPVVAVVVVFLVFTFVLGLGIASFVAGLQ